MNCLFTIKIIKLAVLFIFMSMQTALSQEIESDFDSLSSPKTTIKGLHRLFIGIPVGENLSFGQAVYSGASGDGGGAFFWGLEATKRFPIAPKVNFALSGFLGGGGGAAQVVGDGTMWRVGAVGEYALTPNWALRAGISRMAISGAPINDWATSFGLRYQISSATDRKSNDDIKLTAAKFRTSRFQFPNTLSRSGKSQNPLQLMGAEASFSIRSGYDAFLGADGAVSGGDGYMQILGGLRRHFSLGPISVFGQTSIGFGGGGDVNTGGGLIAGAAVGTSFPIGETFSLDLTYGILQAIDSNISGHGAQIGLSRNFARHPSQKDHRKQQKWQVGIGLSMQSPNSTYMKSRSNVGIEPVMQESSIDFFVGEKTYLTGNAQTTISGGVAGYAVGLVGLGHEFNINDFWRFSIEAHVGAAGGGGVDVGKGLMGGARIEADYILNSENSISLGLGFLTSFDGGLNVPIVQLGYKHRFKTN